VVFRFALGRLGALAHGSQVRCDNLYDSPSYV
jgi:hypothetical protein